MFIVTHVFIGVFYYRFENCWVVLSVIAYGAGCMISQDMKIEEMVHDRGCEK